jgi:hypothetical protein
MFGRAVSAAALAVMSCLVVPASRADAQITSLVQGVRARVRAPGSLRGRVTGVVVSRTADSLSLATEIGVPIQVPLAGLTAVEISQGRSRTRGAMKGALWGGGIGALSGLFSDSGSADASRGEVFAAGVIGGVIVGAVIGAFVQSEQWERIDLSVRTAVLPTRGGAAAVVSIRF